MADAQDEPPASDPAVGWFFEDRAITDAADDHLGHRDVALSLVDAIRSSKGPTTIGLLGGFGCGKSSTANLAIGILGNDPVFEAVRVSADKHSGAARARNLVHAVAGELVDRAGLNGDEVEELLRPLRQGTQVSALDPTDTPMHRLGTRYQPAKLAQHLLLLGGAVAGIVIACVVAGVPFHQFAAIVVSSPVVVWAVLMLAKGTDTPIGALQKPATLTDEKPRAEAADDIELVFGSLVDHHHRAQEKGFRRTKARRLVVFVDDIDRLDSDDLLDALRSLRSLQNIPKGREPIFVLACNETIVRNAIERAWDHALDGGAETDPPAAGTATAVVPAAPEAVTTSGMAPQQDNAALAFLEKLLTARIFMPPPLPGDMRDFAHKLIPPDHPLRQLGTERFDKVVTVLVHSRTSEPRSVIRLLNSFVASYRLGTLREKSGLVKAPDVTAHPEVLAQLAVLRDEHREFYDAVVRNEALLPAAVAIALRRTDLTDVDRDAISRDPRFVSSDGGFRFRDEGLRRYLFQTASHVRYPEDLGPLLHFAATPGGRVLGSELRHNLLDALRVGDPEILRSLLDELPQDHFAATAGELVVAMDAGSRVDAANLLGAVAVNLPLLGAEAESVAVAAAGLLARFPATPVDGPSLTALLEATPSGFHDDLCRHLVRAGGDFAETDDRMRAAARYLLDHPALTVNLANPLLAWLADVPDQGGWELAPAWLDIADAAPESTMTDIGRAVCGAVAGLLRSSSGVSAADAERLVDAVRRFGASNAVPTGSRANALGQRSSAVVLALVTRLFETVDASPDPPGAVLLSRAAESVEVAVDVRRSAAVRLVCSGSAWANATYAKKEDDEGEAKPIAADIVARIAAACTDPDTCLAVLSEVGALTDLAEGDALAPLLEAGANTYQAIASGRSDAASTVGRRLADALGLVSAATASRIVTLVLAPLRAEGDPTSPDVRNALDLLGPFVASPNGVEGVRAEATGWSSILRTSGKANRSVQVAAFGELAVHSEELVTAHAPAVLQQATAFIASGDDADNRLRDVATFPWPKDASVAATALLDQHWTQVPPAARPAAIELALDRGELDEAAWARFAARLPTEIEGDSDGSVARTAAAHFGNFDVATQARLLAAALPHGPLAEAWKALPLDDAVVILLEVNSDAAAVLLSAWPNSALLAERAIEQVLEEPAPRDLALIELLSRNAGLAALSAAAGAAVQRLPLGNSTDAGLLRIAATAHEVKADVDLGSIEQKLAQLLGEADDAVQHDLGRLMAGRRLGRNVEGELKEIRGRRSLEVFDAARSGRH